MLLVSRVLINPRDTFQKGSMAYLYCVNGYGQLYDLMVIRKLALLRNAISMESLLCCPKGEVPCQEG